ncbi:MAG: hypothetical protein AAB493_00275 [Patescibacteria group bacterium]
MKNINKNLILFGLILFTLIAFGSIPKNASAFYYVGWVNGNYIGCETNLDNYGNFIGCGNTNSNTVNNTTTNPIPNILSISPNSKNFNSNTTIITITGSNFIQTSVVRFNYSDRPTTYISSGTLQFQLNSSDISNVGTFPVIVVNMGPGGGISNVITFNVNNNPVIGGATSKTNGTTVSNAKKTSTVAKTTKTNAVASANSNNSTTNNGLSANVLFASNGFLPSNFLQWIFVFILILFIILLWRKFYVSDREREIPLKHA